MAKWVYQMTPHDEWDYDGINEMILAEKEIDGKLRKVLVHFDRNGFAYTMDRVTVNCWWPRSTTRRSTGPPCRHGDRPSAGGGAVLHRAERRGRELHRHLPGRSRHQGPAAGSYSPKTGVFYVPTNHVCMDYEPFRSPTPPVSPMSARR
jgi:glucose dehydrogenase